MNFQQIKYYLFFSILLFSGKKIYAQDSIPFHFEASYYGDGVYIFDSKSGPRICYLGLGFSGIHLFTDKLKWWKGGEFIVHGMNTHGANPTENFTGDIHTFSNLEAPDATFIYQLAYKQVFNKVMILVGINDMAAYFQSSDNSLLFINSSFGVNPSISNNNPVSIFPKNALGTIIQIKPNKQLAFNFATFDGEPGNLDNDPYNVDWKFKKEDGIFNIAELQYFTFKNNNPDGSFKIGGYYHSGYFTNITDTNSVIKGNSGFYFDFDKNVWNKGGKTLSAFLQGGYAIGIENYIDFYLGGGLILKGFMKKQPDNFVAVAFAHASLNNELVKKNNQVFDNHDTALELTASFQITKNIRIQPDAQYIFNPGGMSVNKNAIIGLLRTEINFCN